MWRGPDRCLLPCPIARRTGEKSLMSVELQAAPAANKAGAREVTELLRAWGSGDTDAPDALARLVYAELRRQARLTLRRESNGHTLQTTALVHEAWLRLDAQQGVQWESRAQFFAVAAQMMRRVLVDHARARRALKRGGAPVQVTLGAVDREGPALDAPAPATA